MRPVHLERLPLGLTPLVSGSAAASAQSVALAGPPAPDSYVTVIEESRALIDSVMRARKIPGLSIAVSVDGRTVCS